LTNKDSAQLPLEKQVAGGLADPIHFPLAIGSLPSQLFVYMPCAPNTRKQHQSKE
jgi:hypothetical protein